MTYQFDDFLTASQIMRQAFKEVSFEQNSDADKKIKAYKKLLSDCNNLIMKKIPDRRKREHLKSHIDNMLMPIFINKLDGNEKRRNDLNTPLRERKSLYHFNLNYII